MILKSNCNQNLTLQRQRSATAAMTDHLRATTGRSFSMKKKKKYKKRQKKRKKKHG